MSAVCPPLCQLHQPRQSTEYDTIMMALKPSFAAVAGCTGLSILLAASYSQYCQRPLAPLQSSYTTGSKVMAHYKSDLRNKTFIVTGSTSGLGLETARVLFLEGDARVILAVRDLKAGSALVASLTAAYAASPNAGRGGSVSCSHLDLSSLVSVRSFAASFLQGGSSLSGLVNNGGVFQLPGPTPDGHQNVWQTNYLSHALLTDLLLPAASKSFRIVNVSSKLHRMVGGGGLAARLPPPPSGGGSYGDYALSKACQVAQTFCLERTFAAEAAEGGGGGEEDGLRGRARARQHGDHEAVVELGSLSQLPSLDSDHQDRAAGSELHYLLPRRDGPRRGGLL